MYYHVLITKFKYFTIQITIKFRLFEAEFMALTYHYFTHFQILLFYSSPHLTISLRGNASKSRSPFGPPRVLLVHEFHVHKRREDEGVHGDAGPADEVEDEAEVGDGEADQHLNHYHA